MVQQIYGILVLEMEEEVQALINTVMRCWTGMPVLKIANRHGRILEMHICHTVHNIMQEKMKMVQKG